MRGTPQQLRDIQMQIEAERHAIRYRPFKFISHTCNNTVYGLISISQLYSAAKSGGMEKSCVIVVTIDMGHNIWVYIQLNLQPKLMSLGR